MSPNRILATALLFASAFASADVHIDESIPYRDKEEIDTRIVSECLEVGSIMSKSLQETAAKSDVLLSVTVKNKAHTQISPLLPL
jgi:hypothetical protein